MFESLSNQKLLEAYKKAMELKLEKDFIDLLITELTNRGLKITK
ncbi:sporulation histidine kinase inhibitor Sda [Aquibacillus albus]|uniref:Sporulation histidine kinase inhibitor Sda n=1 Tax=Aquibacillus albus TaxID=1168171 RepID=A0ABS2N2M9_9BACI|nr:sporulation histidine kinase inhibitor Sda [Aquibacillus albus]MBM7572390.1 hypothetical protein [Aquibacillus albus]